MFDLESGVPRGYDDLCGSLRVMADQARIVASNFCNRPLRMVQKVQVVNRDDLGSAPGGDRQGVRRVHHVEVGPSQRFHWWPSEPVPAVIQDADRHPAVDGPHARRRWAQAILPGAAEDRQIDQRAAPVAVGERRHEAVDPLPDTRTRSKGGPIVDQDTHAGWSSTRTLRLTRDAGSVGG